MNTPDIEMPNNEKRVYFDAVETPGNQQFVLVDAEHMTNVETGFTRDDGSPSIIKNALRMTFATKGNTRWSFVRTWPKAYSPHKLSWYTALSKAAIGRSPAAGDNVADLMGKGVMLEIVNSPRVSKAGKEYETSAIAGKPTQVPHGLPPLNADEAMAAYAAELKRQEDTSAPSQSDVEEVVAESSNMPF